jgi:DNA-binding response OmpR family regulator
VDIACVKKHDIVLLAEDSEDDLVLMRYAFRKAGILNQVHEVRDAHDAENYLNGVGLYSNRVRYPLPCVIITDLKMPYNGISFLKWLQGKDEFHRVPKLVLSTSGMDSDRNEAAELGACAFFVKPSDLQELVKVVISIDDDWISEHCPLSPSKNQESPPCAKK